MRLVKQRKSALYIGYSLIIMTVAAMVAMGAIFAPLFEAESSDYSSLLNRKEHLYLIGLILWVLIFITDLIVSIAVFKYYRSKDQKKASISAGFRLMYTLILGYAIVYLVIGYVELISANVNYNAVRESVLRFQSVWQNALIIFGLHLITLSPLVCKKGSVQMVISILLFLKRNNTYQEPLLL